MCENKNILEISGDKMGSILLYKHFVLLKNWEINLVRFEWYGNGTLASDTLAKSNTLVRSNT